MNGSKSLHKFWWLWAPVLVMGVQISIELFLPRHFLTLMYVENGPYELLEFAVMFVAVLVALFTLRRVNWKENKWLGAWVLLALVCCIYVAGEEVSWGQHFAQWSTPEYWMHLNDQGETNLHNTSSWLDQKPRLILLIGIIVGGLLIPAFKKFKPSWVPQRFEIIYPPALLGVTAFFCLGIQILDAIDDALKDTSIFTRSSEVQELYMFYFVLLYLVCLRRRIMQDQR